MPLSCDNYFSKKLTLWMFDRTMISFLAIVNAIYHCRQKQTYSKTTHLLAQ